MRILPCHFETTGISMLRAKILAASFAALAGLAVVPASAAVNLIQDGDFNNPVAGNPFDTPTAGNNFGAGNVWHVDSGSVDVIGNYWQTTPSGAHTVDLDGNAPGGISQSFTAAAGTYNLSFYLSGNPDGGPAIKEMTVSVGNIANQLFNYTVTGDKTNMNYVLEHLTFTSTGGANSLSFLSQDVGSPYGAVVGGISISAVPEPATWTMLILGFGAVGFMLRSTRRRALAA